MNFSFPWNPEADIRMLMQWKQIETNILPLHVSQKKENHIVWNETRKLQLFLFGWSILVWFTEQRDELHLLNIFVSFKRKSDKSLRLQNHKPQS